MSVMRIEGTSPECVKQVMRNLAEIGNIVRFSYFAGDIPSPYANVPGIEINEDGEQHEKLTSYRLILHGLDSNLQVWIELAAYKDEYTSSDGAVEILQLLGARTDFSKVASGAFIQEEAVQVEHHLNYIIRQKQCEDEADDLTNEKLMKVMMRFSNPYDRWKTKEMLALFGRFEPLRLYGGEEAETYYFRMPFNTKQELSHCATNNVLTLHRRFEGSDAETMRKLAMQIAEERLADITTRLYEKTLH